MNLLHVLNLYKFTFANKAFAFAFQAGNISSQDWCLEMAIPEHKTASGWENNLTGKKIFKNRTKVFQSSKLRLFAKFSVICTLLVQCRVTEDQTPYVFSRIIDRYNLTKQIWKSGFIYWINSTVGVSKRCNADVRYLRMYTYNIIIIVWIQTLKCYSKPLNTKKR